MKASCLPVSTRDDRLKTLYKIYNGYKSVDWQGEAWYRVMGEAGTRIPEAPFTSVYFNAATVTEQVYNCGTYCPGYLPSGSHPQTPGELVEYVKVCYNCNNDICQYSNTKWGGGSNNVVKIRHCGEYFVYYLTKPTYVDLRYCTE